jgi:hypothetical protein
MYVSKETRIHFGKISGCPREEGEYVAGGVGRVYLSADAIDVAGKYNYDVYLDLVDCAAMSELEPFWQVTSVVPA